MGRVRFLQKHSLQQTLDLFVNPISFVTGAERVAVEASLGRVLAEPVFARESVPHYHGAAMDGIAVRAEDTYNASDTNPVRLERNRDTHCFEYIDTGQPLPSWANAVVMIEHVVPLGDGAVEIRQPATPWQHVRLVGEDIVASEPLLPRGHRIRPHDIGALLATGHMEVLVRLKPKVVVIPTGSELVEPGQPLSPGNIVEFNSRMVLAFLAEWGAEGTRWDPLPDEPGALAAAIRRAVEDFDVVVLIAGSSAGEKDFTARILRDCGEVLVHGIDIMPGKPTVCARVGNKPVLGLPGYPVSAAIVAQQILQPLVCRLLGVAAPLRPKVKTLVGRKIPSKLGLEEFVRVNLGVVGKRAVAVPLARGAGAITTLVRADGFLRIPSHSEGVEAGSKAVVELLRPWEEIEGTILVTGSHDLTLGLLEDTLRCKHSALRLAVSNVGSLAGLLALARGETHVAGCHLFDPQTEVYNLPDVARIVGPKAAVVVHLAVREQGLIVPKGNPKGVYCIRDLTRPDIRIVNRQPGAGTRVLLDHWLQREGISPAQIRGYEREEFSHMAVAAAVASGLADCGVGLRSAAAALGLDFVLLEREEYDLVFRRDFFRTQRAQWLLEAIRSTAFRDRASHLPGYDVTAAGTVKMVPPVQKP